MGAAVRIRLERLKPLSKGVGVELEIRYRQASWLKTVWVPLAWLATDEVCDLIMAERDRQHRSLEDPGRPWLPLEVWE